MKYTIIIFCLLCSWQKVFSQDITCYFISFSTKTVSNITEKEAILDQRFSRLLLANGSKYIEFLNTRIMNLKPHNSYFNKKIDVRLLLLFYNKKTQNTDTLAFGKNLTFFKYNNQYYDFDFNIIIPIIYILPTIIKEDFDDIAKKYYYYEKLY